MLSFALLPLAPPLPDRNRTRLRLTSNFTGMGRQPDSFNLPSVSGSVSGGASGGVLGGVSDGEVALDDIHLTLAD